MSQTVGDFIVRRLSQWSVRRIFGYRGDGINGVIGALARGDADALRTVRGSLEEIFA